MLGKFIKNIAVTSIQKNIIKTHQLLNTRECEIFLKEKDVTAISKKLEEIMNIINTYSNGRNTVKSNN